MKRTYQLVLGILIAAILIMTTGCDELDTPKCGKGGKVVHEVDEVEGTISFDLQTGAKIVTYFVPGTIDSAWFVTVIS